MERTGRFSDPPVEVAIPSPLQWHYRNRVQVVPVPGTRPGTRVVGFRRAHSHDPVPAEHCYISDERINSVIADAPWSSLSNRDWAAAEEIDIRVAPGQPPLVRAFGPDGQLIRDPGNPSGKTLHYDIAGVSLEVPADAFFQINLAAAELLIANAIDWLAPSPRDHVIDAYGGVGTFGIALAHLAGTVTIVEAAGAAIEAVPRNAAANGVTNVRAVPASVERGLFQMRENVDLLLVDPPRRGCGPEAGREILRLAPKRIVYVSCEPSTLARDLRQLAEGGYRLTRSCVVDMFPQTYHLESVSLLER